MIEAVLSRFRLDKALFRISPYLSRREVPVVHKLSFFSFSDTIP